MFEGKALCFDCEEDMLHALEKDQQQFKVGGGWRGASPALGGGRHWEGQSGLLRAAWPAALCCVCSAHPRCNRSRTLPVYPNLRHQAHRAPPCPSTTTPPQGSVVVIRYEGPKGGPGMPEMLTPTSAIMGAGLGKECALITDGRFRCGRGRACRGGGRGVPAATFRVA